MTPAINAGGLHVVEEDRLFSDQDYVAAAPETVCRVVHILEQGTVQPKVHGVICPTVVGLYPSASSAKKINVEVRIAIRTITRKDPSAKLYHADSIPV